MLAVLLGRGMELARPFLRQAENDRRDAIQDFFRRHWNPEKIEKPTVDTELEDLDAATRSCEVIRFSLLSLEWWLSPQGTLRAWLKLNGRIASMRSRFCAVSGRIAVVWFWVAVVTSLISRSLDHVLLHTTN